MNKSYISKKIHFKINISLILLHPISKNNVNITPYHKCSLKQLTFIKYSQNVKFKWTAKWSILEMVLHKLYPVNSNTEFDECYIKINAPCFLNWPKLTKRFHSLLLTSQIASHIDKPRCAKYVLLYLDKTINIFSEIT